MKTLALCVAVSVFSFSALAKNTNQWYPPKDIPNIHLTELYTYNGLPKNTIDGRDINILVNHGFAIGYSEELKNPLYAVYRYGNVATKSEKIDERYYERPPKFQIDLRTNARVHHSDFNSSGFDRGHIAPNYGIRTQYGHLSQIETFMMSNISPQHEDLNQGIWMEREKQVVKEAQVKVGSNKVKDLWVISGTIFDKKPKTIKDTGIAIPSGFYKILVRKTGYWDNQVQVMAIYYPHFPKDGEEAEQIVSVDWLEEKAGFDFFPNQVDKIEDKIEGTKRDWSWSKRE